MALTTAKRHSATVALSVALHGAVAGGASWAAYHGFLGEGPAASSLEGPARAQDLVSEVEIVLPVVGEGHEVENQPVDSEGDPPRARADRSAAHPDTGAPGRGGDRADRAPALNLAEADERMRLSPDLLSRMDRDQMQRLRVARRRASFEDRRSTTHPSELTLVSTGPGVVRERRPLSLVEPSRGALDSARPSVRGAAVGSPVVVGLTSGERAFGGERAGSLQSAPGMGLARERPGLDHRDGAPIGSARPDVAEGPVAVAAVAPGRPKDDAESEQEVATRVRSLVHASTAGGFVGEGEGGSGGGGVAGTGGPSGAGFVAEPDGQPDGDLFDYWTRDPRLVPYFRLMHAKIDALWADAFPKRALLDLKQGTVILEFTVFADGRASVAWPPIRPSGIEEFDRNCADAIRRAGPFPPLPRALGVEKLRIRAPFFASNPIIK